MKQALFFILFCVVSVLGGWAWSVYCEKDAANREADLDSWGRTAEVVGPTYVSYRIQTVIVRNERGQERTAYYYPSTAGKLTEGDKVDLRWSGVIYPLATKQKL